jgi:acyl carrier protein
MKSAFRGLECGSVAAGDETRVMGATVLGELAGIVRDVFDDQDLAVTAATTPGDVPGWDSGKTVMLVLAVEARFGVTFKSREIERLRSVGDWVRLLAAHGVHG